MSLPTLYERIGGDAGVRALVDRFYDVMDSDPSVQPLRAMHAKSLRVSRDKLYIAETPEEQISHGMRERASQ